MSSPSSLMEPVTRAFDEVVHAVEGAQKRRLAAARGADERCHTIGLDPYRDAFHASKSL